MVWSTNPPLCSICQKNPASIFITKIINNKKTELKLCMECAKKEGLNIEAPFLEEVKLNIPVPEFLTGLFEPLKPPKKKTCPKCNTSFEEIVKTTFAGCPVCYKTFEKEFESLIKNIHGTSYHPPEKLTLNYDEKLLAELKAKLKEKIKNEEYEEAAKIRDMIKEIEKNKK